MLLADEPTGNLDESMRDEILAVLESLCAEGLTLIVVTHDSAVAQRARRRLRLERGHGARHHALSGSESAGGPGVGRDAIEQRIAVRVDPLLARGARRSARRSGARPRRT